MALENVHVMEKDRASGAAKLVHINPTRTFCIGTPIAGHVAGKNLSHASAWYTYQNGEWYGLGGNSVPEKDVPQECKDNIAKIPFGDVALSGTPSVTKVCKFCGEKLNNSQYDGHMEDHVTELMKGSAAKATAPASAGAKP